MKGKFQRVILYARQYRANQGVNESLEHLAAFLKGQQIAAFVDIDTAVVFDLNLPILPRQEMNKETDLIVVVGGDGSMLAAARLAIDADLPVIGINRGRLGFLTDISPQDIDEQLGMVLKGRYREEQRFLLKATIYDEHGRYFEKTALNDVVLSRGNATHLIDFDVYVDQQFVSHYRADGMILATPTGSTAYALSAGGPIMHPSLNAIVLVPLFSHSLSSRPLVVNGKSIIDLLISNKNELELQIICDGNTSHEVRPGQQVAIEKSGQRLHLLHPHNYHYYDTLRSKLGWGINALGK